MSEFDKFIEAVENEEITGRGLLKTSLDYRTALRIAFEAGQKTVVRCIDYNTLSIAWGRSMKCEDHD